MNTNKCKIEGSEITFNMEVDLTELLDKVKDIVENVDKYSDYKKDTEGSYYGFLKYLWIKFPDGTEEQLYKYYMENT